MRIRAQIRKIDGLWWYAISRGPCLIGLGKFSTQPAALQYVNAVIKVYEGSLN